MSGIFFEGGVSCSLTVNAQCNVGISQDCAALYYPPRCNVGVNPLQMNAVISELANAINVVNVGKSPSLYDCTRLDNLARVIANIRNICNQPPLSVNIDGTDRIAGCFDSESGTITVDELLEYINGQTVSLCDQEVIEKPDFANTLLMACIAGEEKLISASFMSSVGGRYRTTDRYFGKGTQSSLNTGSFSVVGKTVLMINNRTSFPQSSGPGENTNVVGYTFSIYDDNGQLQSFTAQGYAIFLKLGEDWYGKSPITEAWVRLGKLNTFSFVAGQFSSFNVYDAVAIGG